jgi:hypothetical protein
LNWTYGSSAVSGCRSGISCRCRARGAVIVLVSPQEWRSYSLSDSNLIVVIIRWFKLWYDLQSSIPRCVIVVSTDIPWSCSEGRRRAAEGGWMMELLKFLVFRDR